MKKSIQQILEEERLKSKISKMSDQHVNIALANKAKAEDPVWKETHKQAIDKVTKTPKWIEAHSKGTKNNSKNKEWVKKIGDKNRERNNKPEFIEKVKTGLRRLWDDPEYENERQRLREAKLKSNTNKKHIANRKKGIRDHFNSPAGEEHRKQMKLIHAKPMMTPEGVFVSLTEAGLYYKAKGLSNAKRKIEGWLKTDPKNFYRITMEEYNKLSKK